MSSLLLSGRCRRVDRAVCESSCWRCDGRLRIDSGLGCASLVLSSGSHVYLDKWWLSSVGERHGTERATPGYLADC